jgi:hypothetical protein
MQTRTFSSLAVALGMIAGACGGDDRQAVYPPQQCAQGFVFDGQRCIPESSTTVTPPPPDAGSTPPADASVPPPPPAGGAAKPLDPAAAQAATQLLAPLAQQAAPGAKPIGPTLAGEFQQGQTLEGTIQMQAGKCYTVVGAGAPNVQDLDIELTPILPLPGVQPIVAQDQTDQPNAIVGEKPNCFKALLAGTMKMTVRVQAGQGIAAAQAYEK